jgi:hypothetical protein
MGRKILAGVVGVILASVVVAAVEHAGRAIYPPPPGLDPNNLESIRANMDRIPTGALLFVPLAWFLGTAAGACLAAWVGGRLPALIVGGLLLAMCLFMLVMLPSPAWFWPLGLAAAPLGTAVGLALGRRPALAV